MAFTNSVADIMVGTGNPTISAKFNSIYKREAVATNVGTTNITVPSTGSIAPAISCGYCRIKSATVGVNATFQVGITVTDGTTTLRILALTAASTAGDAIDYIVHFRSQLSITSVTFTVVVATANSTVDVEIAGNP